jgi:hypothetical protein
MGSFVAKKQKNCDPAQAADDHKGAWWDHGAFDPEHTFWSWRWSPGRASPMSAAEVVAAVKGRLGGRPSELMTSDEYPVSATVIEEAFSRPVVALRETARPGRRPLLPERRLDPGVTYMRRSARSGRTTASWPSLGQSCWGGGARWTEP